MKKSKITKLMLILLCTGMLFSTIISSSALKLQTFAGTIISETDIDLSGIEIKVFEEVHVRGSSGKAYRFSVYTDENGRFSFEKPFGTCFCEINLETLPLGYGISKSNIYVPRERISDEIKLSRITDADISAEGEEIRVRFLDSAGSEVNVQYKIVPYDSQPMELGCEDLKSITSYTYGGEVVTAWNSFEYSFTRDISEYSSIEKLNYLSNKGIIEGRNTYYSLLLDFLSDGEEDNIECGTGFYPELSEYAEVCDDPILKTRIYKMLGMEQEEPDNNTEETKAFETKETFILSAVLFLLATMGVCIIIFKCKRR